MVKKIALAALLAVFASGSALAQSCESKAIDKNGKPLVGAAKTSFITKCKRDTCTAKAVGKNGKPLKGAARNSFMMKCEKSY